MKKSFMLFVLGLLLVSMPAMAVEVAVQAGPVARFYNDADNAVGAGVEVGVSDVFVDGLKLSTGLEKISTEVGYQVGVPGSTFNGTTAGFITTTGKNSDGNSAGSFDLELTTWSFNAGYAINVNDKLTVTPGAGLDFIFVDAGQEFTADNTTGVHVGAEVAYKVNENVSLVGQAGYQFASVDAQINAAGGTVNGGEVELDMNNPYVGGALVYSF